MDQIKQELTPLLVQKRELDRKAQRCVLCKVSFAFGARSSFCCVCVCSFFSLTCAFRYASAWMWGGFGYLVAQWCALARLTWWEVRAAAFCACSLPPSLVFFVLGLTLSLLQFNWDIMEPVTYFVTFGTSCSMFNAFPSFFALLSACPSSPSYASLPSFPFFAGTAVLGYAYFVLTKREYTFIDLRDSIATRRMMKHYGARNFPIDKYFLLGTALCSAAQRTSVTWQSHITHAHAHSHVQRVHSCCACSPLLTRFLALEHKLGKV